MKYTITDELAEKIASETSIEFGRKITPLYVRAQLLSSGATAEIPAFILCRFRDYKVKYLGNDFSVKR